MVYLGTTNIYCSPRIRRASRRVAFQCDEHSYYSLGIKVPATRTRFRGVTCTLMIDVRLVGKACKRSTLFTEKPLMSQLQWKSKIKRRLSVRFLPYILVVNCAVGQGAVQSLR